MVKTKVVVASDSYIKVHVSSSMEQETQIEVPRGKPKSGRWWKTTQENRHSEIKRDKPLKTSWAQKMEQKNMKKAVKQFEQTLKDAKQLEKEEKKKRREENNQRRLENEKKAEIVQKVKNKAKLKRTKKKQLRKVTKKSK